MKIFMPYALFLLLGFPIGATGNHIHLSQQQKLLESYRFPSELQGSIFKGDGQAMSSCKRMLEQLVMTSGTHFFTFDANPHDGTVAGITYLSTNGEGQRLAHTYPLYSIRTPANVDSSPWSILMRETQYNGPHEIFFRQRQWDGGLIEVSMGTVAARERFIRKAPDGNYMGDPKMVGKAILRETFAFTLYGETGVPETWPLANPPHTHQIGNMIELPAPWFSTETVVRFLELAGEKVKVLEEPISP